MKIPLNKKGFTIIETIIGLIIISLMALLINSSMLYINKTDKHPKNETINYYVFLNTIESKKLNLKLVKINSNVVTLINPLSNKKYRIQIYKNMIRLSGNKNGHVPLLENVYYANFRIYKKHLFIQLMFNNHQKFESVSSIEKER